MKLEANASWSAATSHRPFRLGDLSDKLRRVERRDNKQPAVHASPVSRGGHFSNHQIVDDDKSPHSKAAFSRIELIVIVCIFVLIVLVLIPSLAKVQTKARLIDCSGNLKQVGLSFRMWNPDSNSGAYPMTVSTNYGAVFGGTYNGTREVSNLVWRTLLEMSNELATPLILACPADTRSPTTSFATLQNTNISYFIGLDADESMPQLLLSGDHHLSNGRPTTNKVLTLQTNDIVGWTAAIHEGKGNIAFADGSVMQMVSTNLSRFISAAHVDYCNGTSNATLRLAMPE